MRSSSLLTALCLCLVASKSLADPPTALPPPPPRTLPATPSQPVPGVLPPAPSATPRPPASPPPLGTIFVTPSWVRERLDRGNAVALDVRSSRRHAAGHLPGARVLELPAEPSFTPEAVRGALEGAGVCRGTVVLYGEAGRGAELARAFLLLEAAGLSDVRVLQGGFAAWQRERLPVAKKQAPAARPCTLEAAPAQALASRASVLESFGPQGFELLDVRDQGWVGDNYGAPPRFSAGHIPYALPFDVTRFGDVAGDKVEPEQVRAAIATLGPRKNDVVRLTSTFILYGEGPEDTRPQVGYLLVRAAGLKAQAFLEGWQGWSQEGTAPVVRIVEADEVARLMEAAPPQPAPRAMLVDLREPWDFRLGYLPGAQVLPLRMMRGSFESFVQQHWPQVERRTVPLIFYCYGRSCVRTREASVIAARMGFRNMLWFREGVDGWRSAGGPLLRPSEDGGSP
jgi:thiosulfate/3-mercaptopyruvate sulfurtransferase